LTAGKRTRGRPCSLIEISRRSPVRPASNAPSCSLEPGVIRLATVKGPTSRTEKERAPRLELKEQWPGVELRKARNSLSAGPLVRVLTGARVVSESKGKVW